MIATVTLVHMVLQTIHMNSTTRMLPRSADTGMGAMAPSDASDPRPSRAQPQQRAAYDLMYIHQC